jgi:hypothetical protein
MSQNLDLTKLLGFETLGEPVSGVVDFRDETVSAKLGAKVGEPTVTAKLDLGRLLGFQTLGEPVSGVVDFRDETVSAKLGAKVGEPGIRAVPRR